MNRRLFYSLFLTLLPGFQLSLAAQSGRISIEPLISNKKINNFYKVSCSNVQALDVIKAICAETGWVCSCDKNLQISKMPIRVDTRGDARDLIRWLALRAGVEVDISQVEDMVWAEVTCEQKQFLNLLETFQRLTRDYEGELECLGKLGKTRHKLTAKIKVSGARKLRLLEKLARQAGLEQPRMVKSLRILLRQLALKNGIKIKDKDFGDVFNSVFLHQPSLQGSQVREKGLELLQEEYNRKAIMFLEAAIRESKSEAQQAKWRFQLVPLLLRAGRKDGAKLEKAKRILEGPLSDYYVAQVKEKSSILDPKSQAETKELRFQLARINLRLGELHLRPDSSETARWYFNKARKELFQYVQGKNSSTGAGVDQKKIYYQAQAGIIKAEIMSNKAVGKIIQSNNRIINGLKEFHPKEWFSLKGLMIEYCCRDGLSQKSNNPKKALQLFKLGEAVFREIRKEPLSSAEINDRTNYFAGRSIIEGAQLRQDQLKKDTQQLHKKMMGYLLGSSINQKGETENSPEYFLARFLAEKKLRDDKTNERSWLVNLVTKWTADESKRAWLEYKKQTGTNDFNGSELQKLEEFYQLFIKGNPNLMGDLSERSLQAEALVILKKFIEGATLLYPLAKCKIGSNLPVEFDLNARLLLARTLLMPTVIGTHGIMAVISKKVGKGKPISSPTMAIESLNSILDFSPKMLNQKHHDWEYGKVEINLHGKSEAVDLLGRWGRLVILCQDLFGSLAQKQQFLEWLLRVEEGRSQLKKLLGDQVDEHGLPLCYYGYLPDLWIELVKLYWQIGTEERNLGNLVRGRKFEKKGEGLLELLAHQAITSNQPSLYPALRKWVNYLYEKGRQREVVEETSKAIKYLDQLIQIKNSNFVPGENAEPNLQTEKALLSHLFSVRMKAFLARGELAKAELASQGKGVLR